MPGRRPKPPELRQNRTKAATAATLDVESEREIPQLPELSGETDWQPLTVSWWNDVWCSPMASQFLDADCHALLRLAVLIDRYWISPSVALAAEIRQEEAGFGLTPLDRMRLQWKLEAAPEKAVRQSADPDEASVYGALSVVK